MNPPVSNVNQRGHRGPFLGGLTRFEKVQKVAQICGQKPTMKKGLVFLVLLDTPKSAQKCPPWGGHF